MKTVSIKKEETQDMENLRKKNKTECKKKKWKANTANYNKQKTESQNSKIKW
jgi:hypothetical protein